MQNGFAINNSDFFLDAPGSVTIPAGSPHKIINLVVLPDNLVEGTEHISMTLQYPPGTASYELINPAATVDIQDNDYWKWDDQIEGDEWTTNSVDPSLGDTSDPLFYTYDSTFEASGNWTLIDNRLSASLSGMWVWYEWTGIATITQHNWPVSRELNLEFDFDVISGDIFPRSGGGVDGVAQAGAATADLSFSYSLNNTGETTKRATITFSAIAAVGGEWQKSNGGSVGVDGKISGEGGEIGVSGNYSGNVVSIGADGGTAISVDPIIVNVTLRSVEDE